MFGKKSRKPQPANTHHTTANVQTEEATDEKPKIETWIGGNAKIRGDIEFTGACSIDGGIEGNISSKDPRSTLILGEQGHIIGNVSVANVYANGKIDGNVMAIKKVELHPKARINGDLHYNLLEMAVGAGVNGKLMHQEAQAVEPVIQLADTSSQKEVKKKAQSKA